MVLCNVLCCAIYSVVNGFGQRVGSLSLSNVNPYLKFIHAESSKGLIGVSVREDARYARENVTGKYYQIKYLFHVNLGDKKRGWEGDHTQPISITVHNKVLMQIVILTTAIYNKQREYKNGYM